MSCNSGASVGAEAPSGHISDNIHSVSPRLPTSLGNVPHFTAAQLLLLWHVKCKQPILITVRSGHMASCHHSRESLLPSRPQWDGSLLSKWAKFSGIPGTSVTQIVFLSQTLVLLLSISSVMFPSAFHFLKSLQSWNKMPFSSTFYLSAVTVLFPPSSSQVRFIKKLSLFPIDFSKTVVLWLPYSKGHKSSPICSASRPLTTSNVAKCYGGLTIFNLLFCSIDANDYFVLSETTFILVPTITHFHGLCKHFLVPFL